MHGDIATPRQKVKKASCRIRGFGTRRKDCRSTCRCQRWHIPRRNDAAHNQFDMTPFTRIKTPAQRWNLAQMGCGKG